MSKQFRGTNYKYGMQIDINNDGGLTDERFIPGSRHEVMYSPFSAAGIPLIFWIAPAPCKIISATERHITVAGQAGSMQVEKIASGTAIGSGTNILATAFDLTSTASTNVTVLGSATLATASIAKGEALAGKVASGAATSYANGSLLLVVEWL
jgi:hypothetical protein